jgi:hypothetical protein
LTGRKEEKRAVLQRNSQKVPKRAKKIFFFSKFQKRSEMLEKMILSPREGVSEWGNREKVAKKEK